MRLCWYREPGQDRERDRDFLAKLCYTLALLQSFLDWRYTHNRRRFSVYYRPSPPSSTPAPLSSSASSSLAASNVPVPVPTQPPCLAIVSDPLHDATGKITHVYSRFFKQHVTIRGSQLSVPACCAVVLMLASRSSRRARKGESLRNDRPGTAEVCCGSSCARSLHPGCTNGRKEGRKRIRADEEHAFHLCSGPTTGTRAVKLVAGRPTHCKERKPRTKIGTTCMRPLCCLD